MTELLPFLSSGLSACARMQLTSEPLQVDGLLPTAA